MHYLLKLVLLSSFSFYSGHVFAADAKRGEVVAKVRCLPCHHLNTSHAKVGPSLQGIYGKKPSITGVDFDVWNEEALQAWLLNPRAIKANTKMLIPKLTERDRTDIIAWLMSRK